MAVANTTIISPKARIGANVTIGNFCTVHDNVVIQDNCTIEDYCTIGHPSPLAEGNPLVVGENAWIRSYSLLYEGSTFGPGLRTGHRVTVREKTTAGTNLQIGTLCDIQGHCEIGDYVRMHSNVHIGQMSKIHDFVWIFPYTVLTNDPHPPSDGYLAGPEVFDYAVIATMTCILPGVRVGEHALVGAHSLVLKDVEAHTVVLGVPAKFHCHTDKIKLKDDSGRPAYPWPRHFHRGYPEHIVREWIAEFAGS
jgi:acetyltransferase-like isoleucine patch superfamily enzyme